MQNQQTTYKNSRTTSNFGSIGAEWSPGRTTQYRGRHQPIQVAKPVNKAVEDVLINWFLFVEQPRADDIKVVKDSLQLVDAQNNVWKAKVQTFIYYSNIETRVHESYVRFRVESRVGGRTPGVTQYYIFHNHVMFP